VNSRWQPDDFVLFLDRNLGSKIIPDRLRSEGLRIEIHDAHLPNDAPDEAWIQLVGQKNWIGITGDKRIRYSAPSRAAIEKHKTRIIVMTATKLRGSERADLLLKYHRRLQHFAANTEPPYLAKLNRSGKIEKEWP